ncbi:hypothetical protein FLAG1_04541 [Fusarium langsethiae]|uniref:Uncharacterized protein n=1 Tax=Fusarium langsethiae TaxID=179993 RepID=A0A0M9EZ75_FUSLA|nr:hypothetical protein FLAG1_04541 [Fusarium langsethiae]GKU00155.1 unnamed protein product [Fusarium langsethiae]GKU10570.1 unnamed protein product [Fusarium langsethiae]
MSPEPFPDDPYRTSHFEPSLEAGSNKENKKRSPDDESDKISFRRRPRRKTRPDRYLTKIADLTFNDTRFLEPSPKKKHKDAQLSTNGETDHDEDDISDNLEPSSRQRSDFLKTAVTEKDTKGKGEPDHTFQEDRDSLNGSNPEPSPETPRTMLKKLIKTGIFDGTGVFKLPSVEEMESNLIQHGDNSTLGNIQPVGSHTGQNEVSMVDPSKDSTLLSTTQPHSNIASFYRKHYRNHPDGSTGKVYLELQDEKTPLHTHATAQVRSSNTANPACMRDKYEPSMTENLSPDLKLAHNSAVNGRWQSADEASEGGCHYVQRIDQKEQRRPRLTNPSSDAADFGYLVHPTGIQSPEPVSMKQPIIGDWQRYGAIKLPQQSLADQHSLHLTHGDVGMPGHSNAQAEQPRRTCGNETVQEFFERIEGEQDLGELQSGDPECDREREPFLDVAYTSPQQEIDPSLLASQKSPGDEVGCIAGRIEDRPNASNAEMVAFWRPNHF